MNLIDQAEIRSVYDLFSLPPLDRSPFWREEFMPLVAQEHGLRERLLVAGQKVSQERSTQ
jgi:hypothetical protein